MEIFDVSMDIEKHMPVYNNLEEKKPIFTVTSDYSRGNYYETRIDIDLHIGTHIDMPLHMINNGKTSDNLDVSKLVSKCLVLDLTHVDKRITKSNLIEKVISPGIFVLLKTKNSFTNVFDPEFVFLDKSGAEYLNELKISGVGIDSLGIERDQPDFDTHKILLQNDILIIEGLRLAEISEGIYNIYALPLKISHVEALPARVVLQRE